MPGNNGVVKLSDLDSSNIVDAIERNGYHQRVGVPRPVAPTGPDRGHGVILGALYAASIVAIGAGIWSSIIVADSFLDLGDGGEIALLVFVVLFWIGGGLGIAAVIERRSKPMAIAWMIGMLVFAIVPVYLDLTHQWPWPH